MALNFQIQLSDAQLNMIKGVTQELTLLRDQQEKLQQLQKLQDAFEADKKTGVPADKVKASLDLMSHYSHLYYHRSNLCCVTFVLLIRACAENDFVLAGRQGNRGIIWCSSS